MKKYHKSVFKSFFLVTQLGISVMVPIALCVAVGVLIDRHFGTWWIIPLLIIGFAAGIRNAAILLTNTLKEDDKTKNNHEERMTDNEEE